MKSPNFQDQKVTTYMPGNQDKRQAKEEALINIMCLIKMEETSIIRPYEY